MNLPAEIFKAYDIRGIVDRTLDTTIVQKIGQGLGSLALEQGCHTVVIGRDGRLSGPKLSAALAAGIQAAGCHVIDIGLAATPMVYFAAHYLETGCAVALTGSHNPPEYNGLKMVINRITLAGEAIQQLKKRIESGQLSSGQGQYQTQSIESAYYNKITGHIRLSRPMRIAVDCGNGVAGAYAPTLFNQLGCAVTELFCQVDGNFPNHHPDPSQPKNLVDLIQTVREQNLELGLAFDGDGDRLGVVTADGQIIYPDRQLMLFAADVLQRNPGATIIYDVKSTRKLQPWIREHGGNPLLWKTGHSLIKAKMLETGALLAGEMSGHTFFKERWYGFDDGLYAGARLLEILSRHANPSAILNQLPNSLNTPELNIKLAEGEPHRFIQQLQETALFPGAQEIIKIDGLRVEYPDGFGLVRASNTTPVLVLRFEGDTPAALERIQQAFRHALLTIKADLVFSF